MGFPRIDLKKRIIIFAGYTLFFNVVLAWIIGSYDVSFIFVLIFAYLCSVVLGIYILYYFLKDGNMLDDYVIDLLEEN